MNINILAGGPIELLPDLSGFQSYNDVWVGVDKGVFTLLSKDIRPSMAFGDFDSVTIEEMELIEKSVKGINRFMPEKDETDMELAMNWALNEKPNRIRIFGATGGRIDHFLANIQLLLKPIQNKDYVHAEIIDQKN